MMREHDKARCFNQAIDLLVEAAVARTQPREPGAYASTVRADLRARLRPTARQLFTEHDDLTADELALLLEASERPQQQQITDPASPAVALGAWHGPTEEPSDGPVVDRSEAVRRLAAIKEALTTRKPTREEAS